VNEQIVGHLGKLVNAPIPPVQIVGVPTDLVILNRLELDHLYAGLAHGSPLQENCTDKKWLANTDVPENERRFAALAVLYGWAYANDPQMIYCLTKPHLVWSVDHGNFFPGGPNWTVAHLQAADDASVHSEILTVCRDYATRETLDVLATVQPEQIATAVAAPPKTWAIAVEERRELAIMLEKRRNELLA
jgi:hypothetical protein